MKTFKIVIGRTDDADVTLDAKNLIYSRALIQANSGGGKSGLLRVIAEQVASAIPTIIIDKEGEYSTLREKIDLVLVGERGELEADLRSAKLLARKLVELGASAVIDLSGYTDVKSQQEFVRDFLDALIFLPRGLWHPTFVMIDEAHTLAPESGMGESVATGSIVNLMSLGRKRGFGGLLATTRLSKLHKNAADANNIFIGRTVLDVDQTRAGKTLGLKPKDLYLLRDLPKQNFYAFGPDLNYNGVEVFRVSDCETTIPKPGDRKSLTPPKASHVVLEIAEKMKDIKTQAETEIRDLDAAQKEIRRLGGELRKAQAGISPNVVEKTVEKVKVVEKPVIKDAQLKRIETLERALGKRIDALTGTEKTLTEFRIALAGIVTGAELALRAQAPTPRFGRATVVDGNGQAKTVPVQEPVGESLARKSHAVAGEHKPTETASGERADVVPFDGKVSASQQRILNVLAWFESIGKSSANKKQLAFMSNASPSSSTYQNNLSELSKKGLIEYPEPGYAALLTEGRARAKVERVPTTTEELHDQVFKMLTASQSTILKVLIEIYPQMIHKTDLAARSEASAASSTFQNNCSDLRGLGLIDYPKKSYAVAQPVLFLKLNEGES